MYKIHLPVFEGPFDLLLYLIRKNEIDIYDIPIAQITREYLEYLELMQLLDLEVAGEFIEMVATLILIKTRMLLPRPPAESAEEVEDPRRQLTLQLLEYKRFKEAAGALQKLEEERRRYFPRNARAQRKQVEQATREEDDFEIDATLFDLLTAFKRALDNMPKVTVHQVQTIKLSLEDQVQYIIGRCQGQAFMLFSELIRELPTRLHLIVTFMALLDLMKLGMISARQNEVFGEIRLVPRGELSMSRYLSEREQVQVAPTEAAED
ncbi:MAG: hypothetical protein D6681_11915 [Calditrichaeota bacterium]|nr:MAG: hypothetical protein D6681_11915 [Calditrichota bacterium]